MSTYNKSTWADRNVQNPNRYKDQNNNQYTFTADPGAVTDEGTPISAQKLNNIESGIENAHIEIADLFTAIQPSGWVEGIEYNPSTKKIQLYKNPQRIGYNAAFNETMSGVYNKTYEVPMSGGFINRFSRFALVLIKNRSTAYENCVVLLDLGTENKAAYIDPRSQGNYKTLSLVSPGDSVGVNVGANHNLGGNVIINNGASGGCVFIWSVKWDNTAKKVLINVAGMGSFPHVINFEADVTFI